MKRINNEEMVITLIFLSLFAKMNARFVGTPTSATVCNGTTATLTCDISQSGNLFPTWRIFATADTSRPLVASLNSGDNSPPYNYPAVQAGDTVARLEVAASSSIDGYHFQCRLPLVEPVDSPKLGNITIITGIPSCPKGVDLANSTIWNNDCDVSLTWQQPPNTSPVTSTRVTYCPTSSPNCGNSMNCTSPCTIRGLLNDTEYQFTVIPNNNCGSPTECTGNKVTHNALFPSEICSPDTTPTTGSTPQPTGPIIGGVLAVVLIPLIIAIIATILICYFCCKPGSDAKNKPPREEQPRDVYADPQTVRDNKEMIEENRITHATVQSHKKAGGNGKDDIHYNEELDIAG